MEFHGSRTGKSEHYFSEKYLTLRSCVSPLAFGRISHFLREGSLGSPRAVRTGNLDIIPTSCMAVFMAARRFDGFFLAFLAFFRAPPGCPGVERHFSEPSMAKSSLPSRAPAQ